MISDNCQEVMKPNHEAPYWYVEEFEFILQILVTIQIILHKGECRICVHFAFIFFQSGIEQDEMEGTETGDDKPICKLL